MKFTDRITTPDDIVPIDPNKSPIICRKAP